MVREKSFEAEFWGEAESLTVMVTRKGDEAAVADFGTPLIRPPEEIERPLGSPVADQV